MTTNELKSIKMECNVPEWIWLDVLDIGFVTSLQDLDKETTENEFYDLVERCSHIIMYLARVKDTLRKYYD